MSILFDLLLQRSYSRLFYSNDISKYISKKRNKKKIIAFPDDSCQGDSKSAKKIKKNFIGPRSTSIRIQPFDDYLWVLPSDFKC